jgi:hypothetical protein
MEQWCSCSTKTPIPSGKTEPFHDAKVEFCINRRPRAWDLAFGDIAYGIFLFASSLMCKIKPLVGMLRPMVKEIRVKEEKDIICCIIYKRRSSEEYCANGVVVHASPCQASPHQSRSSGLGRCNLWPRLLDCILNSYSASLGATDSTYSFEALVKIEV